MYYKSNMLLRIHKKYCIFKCKSTFCYTHFVLRLFFVRVTHIIQILLVILVTQLILSEIKGMKRIQSIFLSFGLISRTQRNKIKRNRLNGLYFLLKICRKKNCRFISLCFLPATADIFCWHLICN